MLDLSRRDAMRGAVALLLCVVAACGHDNPAAPTPPAPTGLVVTDTQPNAITLRWNSVGIATGYTIQRAPGNSASFTTVGSGFDTTFVDPTVLQDSAYTYRVAATSAGVIGAFSASVFVRTGISSSSVAKLSGHITASRTLFADTTYVLSGFVKVDSGAILTIAAGTTIVGDSTVPGSSLWFLRGSQIDALGRADKPIVFTSQRAPGHRQPGDWGGLVFLGHGVVNRMQSGGQTNVSTRGPSGATENYGGTDNLDGSGTMRYVRVEFAGWSPTPDQEIDAVTSYAVGRGTKYEYVQSMATATDAFSFFGGAVDMRYLVSYEAGDDHFDWSDGFSGRGQFLIGFNSTQIAPNPASASPAADPHAFEGDGCDPSAAGCASYFIAPYSMPVWANFTMVGPGSGVTLGGVTDNSGSVVRRGSGGTFINGVITRFQGTGWSVRDAASDSMRALDSLAAYNVYLSENGAGNYDPADACTSSGNGGSCGTKAKYPATIDGGSTAATSLFMMLPASGTTPTVSAFDWTPASGSIIESGGAVAVPATAQARLYSYFGAQIPLTSYIGAAPPGGPHWWEGWTVYYRN